jgi:hypothetical protein
MEYQDWSTANKFRILVGRIRNRIKRTTFNEHDIAKTALTQFGWVLTPDHQSQAFKPCYKKGAIVIRFECFLAIFLASGNEYIQVLSSQTENIFRPGKWSEILLPELESIWAEIERLSIIEDRWRDIRDAEMKLRERQAEALKTQQIDDAHLFV